ncbi:MAG: hypothetical protein AAGG08_19735, partial [Actinomycetota bacterium]
MALEKSRNGVFTPGTYSIVTSMQDDADGTCATFAAGDDTKEYACLMGIDGPLKSVHDRTVDIVSDPGNGLGDLYNVHAGLNTRFGIYDDLVSALSSNSSFPGDLNTITGDVYACNGERDFGAVTETTGLPIPDCFGDGTCDVVSDPVASAVLTDYCQRTHGGACPTAVDGGAVQTLYDLYLAEIASGQTDPGGNGNYAHAQCNTNATQVANRRVLEVALIDCSQLTDGSVSHTDVPVAAYAEVFLADAVETSPNYTLSFETFDYYDAAGDKHTVVIEEGDVLSTDPRFTSLEADPYDGTYSPEARAGGASYIAANHGNFSPSQTDDDGSTLKYGEVPSSQYTDAFNPYQMFGVTIDIIEEDYDHENSGSHKFAPMIFDADQTGTADPDIENTNWGNILIVSEDGKEGRPDDNADGGTIVIRFDEPTYVERIKVIDTDGGGTVRAFNTVLTDQELIDLDLNEYNPEHTTLEGVDPETTHYVDDGGAIVGSEEFLKTAQ